MRPRPNQAGATKAAEPRSAGSSEQLADAASKRRSFFSAALLTYSTNILVAFLSLLNVIIVARSLGPTGRGEIAFLTTIAILTANIALFGIQEANANLAGSDPRLRPALATNSLLFAAFFGVLAAFAVLSLVWLFPGVGGHASRPLLLLSAGSITVLILQSYLQLLIQADFGFGRTSLAWLAAPVINVSVNGLLAVFGHLSVATAVSTWVAGQFISTAGLCWSVARYGAGFGKPALSLARRSLSFGTKSHPGRVMMQGNYRLDQWLLGAMAGQRELGLYSIAVTWAEALFFLPTAVTMAMRPEVVRMDDQRAARWTSAIFRTSIILTALLAGAMLLAAPILCVGLTGDAYRGSIPQLRILVLGAFGIVALKEFSSTLTARRRTLRSSAGVGIAFALTVLLDLLLIPSKHGIGASIASTLAYTGGGIAIAILYARAFRSSLVELIPRPGDIIRLARRLRDLAKRLGRSRTVSQQPLH